MVKARFVTDLVRITKIMDDMPEQPVIDTSEMALDPDQCVLQPIKKYFICNICTSVVWDPKQCSECECLSCLDCIDQWLKKN